MKALDGPNAEFIFPAIGQGHRNAYPESTYGGVIFGYSADSIRIFVPANDTGTMISIPENWGTADYNQVSNNVEIVVTVWSTTDDGSYTYARIVLAQWRKQFQYYVMRCRLLNLIHLFSFSRLK